MAVPIESLSFFTIDEVNYHSCLIDETDFGGPDARLIELMTLLTSGSWRTVVDPNNPGSVLMRVSLEYLGKNQPALGPNTVDEAVAQILAESNEASVVLWDEAFGGIPPVDPNDPEWQQVVNAVKNFIVTYPEPAAAPEITYDG